MNDIPPFGDATDEAVSALLDDELDDFAAAHGTTSEDVTQRLAAWSGFDDRRRELARVRGAISTGLPTLDALERRRITRVAADAADVAAGTSVPATRAGGRPVPWRAIAIATAAAVIVVVGAAGFGLSRLGGGASSSKASKAAGTAASLPVQANAFVGDVGELSDAATVRALLTQKEAGLPIHTPGEFGASSDAKAQPANPPPSTSAGQRAAAEAADRAAARRCAEVLDRPSGGAAPDPVVLLAAATFHGRPAVVVGVHHGARSVVFVAARDTCAVLTSQSL